MKRLKTMLALVAVAVLNVGMLVPSSVRAQSGLGLEISPVRGDVVVVGGESSSVTIRLTNNVAGPVLARMNVNDFEPQDNGEVVLLDESAKGATSLKDLVQIPEDIRLEPAQSANVEVQISVPVAQPPGTYYGVLRFDALPVSPTAQEVATGVSLGASLGYVLIVEVPGSLTESMSITSLLPERNGTQSRLLAATPESINLTANNNGQTLLKPFGVAQIFDFRNKEVGTVAINGEDTKINVLPGNKRVLKGDASGFKLLPGRYKVVATIAYGKGGQTIDYTTTFWVLPPVFVAVVAIALVALFFAVAYWIKKLRSKSSRHRR